MNLESMEIDYKIHNSYKKALNKDRDNSMEQYKSIICSTCIHYKDINYQDCKICRCIDGVVRCQEYKRRKENEI